MAKKIDSSIKNSAVDFEGQLEKSMADETIKEKESDKIFNDDQKILDAST